ncbi:MAG: hypothetical protein ACLTEX_00795 [Eggerthella lenta]
MTKVMLVDDDASMQVLIEQIVAAAATTSAVRAMEPRPGDAESRASRLP